jgi:hypothetical protein
MKHLSSHNEIAQRHKSLRDIFMIHNPTLRFGDVIIML